MGLYQEIGRTCRRYRLHIGYTLEDVAGGDSIKTLSGFEMGRSTNVKHFLKYLEIADKREETDIFIATLLGDIQSNG